jgi:hypothetical protein
LPYVRDHVASKQEAMLIGETGYGPRKRGEACREAGERDGAKIGKVGLVDPRWMWIDDKKGGWAMLCRRDSVAPRRQANDGKGFADVIDSSGYRKEPRRVWNRAITKYSGHTVINKMEPPTLARMEF